jgi:hypothetical protein
MNDFDILVDSWKAMFGNRDLVTKGEAANFLHWSTRTVDRRIEAGLIRPILLRGSGKFRKQGPKKRESTREWEVRIPKMEILKQFILLDELGRCKDDKLGRGRLAV